MNSSMAHLFRKEFSGHFKTPGGLVFLVIFLFGLGQLTFEPGRGSFFVMKVASLDPFFSYIPWMFLFLVPAITMKNLGRREKIWND